MEFLGVLRSCVTGMVPVTVITLAGAYLTHSKIFDRSSNEMFSSMISKFCFVIFNVVTTAKAVDVDNFWDSWPLIVIPLLFLVISVIASSISIWITNPPDSFRYSTISVLTFTSVGSVPLLILKGICASYGPLAGDKYCDEYSGYVGLCVFVNNLIIWSTCGVFLKLDEKYQNNTEAVIQVSLTRLAWKGFISPVVLASYIGLILGFIPYFRDVFLKKTSDWYVFYDSLYLIAYVGVVIGQSIVGSNLVLLRNTQNILPRSFCIKITLIKSFVLNGIWLLLIIFFWNLGIFKGNRVMAYLIFVAQISPVTIVVMMIAQLLRVGVKECSIMFLWQYIMAPISLTLYTYIFFLII